MSIFVLPNECVMRAEKRDGIIAKLQTDILRLQGFKQVNNDVAEVGLGRIKEAFPLASFPLGAVHEFLPARVEDKAATSGFIAGLLGSLMRSNGTCLWASSSRTLFPPALSSFGIQPDRIIFIDVQKDKDVLWVMDEGLKCGALAAVVGEVHEVSFTASRRLQLAVEQSQVTGFILRRNYRDPNTTTACVSRWRVTSLLSDAFEGLPGIGFPKWRAELLKIKNGKPGVWDVQWVNGRFLPVFQNAFTFPEQQKKAG